MPTPEQINNLPDEIKRYIHDLETRCDHTGDIKTIESLRQQRDALLLTLKLSGINGEKIMSKIKTEDMKTEELQRHAAMLQVRVTEEALRPSVTMKPKLERTGSGWCAWIGKDRDSGLVGFGHTVDAAMRDFDSAYKNQPVY